MCSRQICAPPPFMPLEMNLSPFDTNFCAPETNTNFCLYYFVWDKFFALAKNCSTTTETNFMPLLEYCAPKNKTNLRLPLKMNFASLSKFNCTPLKQTFVPHSHISAFIILLDMNFVPQRLKQICPATKSCAPEANFAALLKNFVPWIQFLRPHSKTNLRPWINLVPR